MNIKVHTHLLEIVKSPINEKELNITKCNFEFDEEMEGVKKAYFTLNDGNTYMQYITNDECDIPNEVLANKGELTIGVSVETIENDETIKRYNPSPVRIATWEGSLKDYKNSETPTPSDLEQIEQMVSNINIDGNKSGKITTITITDKEGNTKTIQVLDGEKGEKGDKGDAGAIKMLIVAELPSTGADDTIYLVPLETPDVQGNNYAEYVYINGAWELLGKIGVQVDLTDYVKNTDYPTALKGGVIKISTSYGTGVLSSGYLTSANKTYSQYTDAGVECFISKGTLENVITGKGLTTKSYVDGLVGDINSVLDAINGEVI